MVGVMVTRNSGKKMPPGWAANGPHSAFKSALVMVSVTNVTYWRYFYPNTVPKSNPAVGSGCNMHGFAVPH